MYKSILLYFSLFVILLPIGKCFNISNANAIADLDLSNDHYYVFPQKSDSLQKLNCNNVNVNVNGLELDVFPPFLGDNGLAAESQEGNSDPSSFAGNNDDGSHTNDFRFICINNNNKQ